MLMKSLKNKKKKKVKNTSYKYKAEEDVYAAKI